MNLHKHLTGVELRAYSFPPRGAPYSEPRQHRFLIRFSWATVGEISLPSRPHKNTRIKCIHQRIPDGELANLTKWWKVIGFNHILHHMQVMQRFNAVTGLIIKRAISGPVRTQKCFTSLKIPPSHLKNNHVNTQSRQTEPAYLHVNGQARSDTTHLFHLCPVTNFTSL